MIGKTTFAVALLCTAVGAVGVVHYMRGQRELEALRAQVATKGPSLGAVQPDDAQPADPPEAPAPSEETLSRRLVRAPTLGEALRLTLPIMGDTTNERSSGAVMLALWGAKQMAWSDIGVAKNETSLARVLKDPDAERGKRMCLSGDIIQIGKERGMDRTFSGLIGAYSYYGQGIVSFISIGDTGDLVEQSAARFCGVVTGRHTYDNTGGGTTHAVNMVGMFDLPGNNPRKRHRAAAEDVE